MTSAGKLHLGCGPGPQSHTAGWIHVDGSWNAWFAKHPVLRRVLGIFRLAPSEALAHGWDPRVAIHDVTKGLPFPEGSLSAVYSSHMLEHLYFDQAERLLRECHRVLAPGGILRIVVPDLRAMVHRYVAETADGNAATAADRLNERLLYRHRQAPAGPLPFRLYTAMTDFHTHKWMYDADSLMAVLTKLGFVEVGPRGPHDSRIADIAAVEARARVEDDGLCIEGVKPGGVR